MRETSLFTFSPRPDKEEGPTVFISVPTSTTLPSSSPTSWSGLSHNIAWRNLGPTTLHLQHVLTKASLSLVFSSPLSARPLFLAPSSPTAPLPLVLACHSHPDVPSTLLLLHLSPILSATATRPLSVEHARFVLPSTRVSAAHALASDAVVALSDGRCALLYATHRPFLTPFSPTPLPNAVQQQSSKSFVSRLFNPRLTQPTPSAPLSDDVLPPFAGPEDPVLALAVLQNTPSYILSLHRSSRIALFSQDPKPHINFHADVMLPCALSSTNHVHFLLPGPEATVLALVLADEHPNADSLRVFEISIELSHQPAPSLSCRQLLTRQGPIPQIVSAAFFAEDVVIATRPGVVTALLNIPPERRSPTSSPNGTSQPLKGLPSGTFWTAVDDVDKPYGLNAAMDAFPADDRVRLLRAHRFTPATIAKALRLPNPETATNKYINDAVYSIHIEDDDTAFKRIIHRAQQITKQEDLRVTDLFFDETIGLVVARDTGLFVMRPLFDSEKTLYANHDDLLSCDQITPHGPLAWLLASQASCQNIASQFLHTSRNVAKDVSRHQLSTFMFNLVTRFSECHPDASLTDLFCGNHANIAFNDGSTLSFPEVMVKFEASIKPGSKLLSGLLSSKEMETLGEAAVQCADMLPITAAFATGIVWLNRYHVETDAGPNVDVILSDEMGDVPANPDALLMLNKAYGFFSFAAESCSDSPERDDVVSALGLAGYPSKMPDRSDTNDAMELSNDWKEWEIQHCLDGDDKAIEIIKLGDCAFWLLERSVRFTESFGIPKSSAALGLEAMKYAPNKTKHEQMRAKAFNHFLQAGDLGLALKAILSAPFQGTSADDVTEDEAEGLRDSIGLFINLTADKNKLKWLAEQELPEPLSMLCGQALERRARGESILHLRGASLRFGVREDEELSEKQEGGEYEDLYAWHMLRGDQFSAGVCALEWAERLNNEGPEVVRALVRAGMDGQTRTDCVDVYMLKLMEWTAAKCEALSCVQAAMRVEGKHKYVARSRFTLAERAVTRNNDVVVDLKWVARRLLLAHAQRKYLARLLSGLRGGGGGLENVDHLASEWSPLMTETRTGVEWVSSMIRESTTYDSMRLCAELCCAWREEIGDSCLVDVVGDAGRAAARKHSTEFQYRDLECLLRYVSDICSRDGLSRRSWYTIALGEALSSCAGRSLCPQWLIDLAAHGFEGEERAGRIRGDMFGAVRALLRNNRPVDAAKVILRGLDKATRSEGENSIYISYSAIDATLEILSQMSEDYSEAETYFERLTEEVEQHLRGVVSKQEEAIEKASVVDRRPLTWVNQPDLGDRDEDMVTSAE